MNENNKNVLKSLSLGAGLGALALVIFFIAGAIFQIVVAPGDILEPEGGLVWVVFSFFWGIPLMLFLFGLFMIIAISKSIKHWGRKFGFYAFWAFIILGFPLGLMIGSRVAHVILLIASKFIKG